MTLAVGAAVSLRLQHPRELQAELAELTAPYSDNQAFVAQLRSEYLVAKVVRG